MLDNINLGIKISTKDFDFLPDIYNNKELIDYIEVTLMPSFSLKDLEIIQSLKLPYAIHLPNSNNNIDFGEKKYEEDNKKFIKKIIQNLSIFQKLNPICYIIHPESGDIKYSIQNLKNLPIRPLVIENMPVKGIRGENLLGFSPDSLKKYFDHIIDLGLCLDINHAIKASITLKKDWLVFINEFLDFFAPTIFHIASGDFKVEIDNHLNLDEGKYDISKIKDILLNLNKIVYLTFETPRNNERRIQDDIKNMQYFLNI